MNRILVIDDSELLRKLLDETLSSHGFEVAVACDANQGFVMAKTFHPDLILLDVQLPDVTGFELCRVFKSDESTRHIPIVMITGTAQSTGEKVRGFQTGADDYVLKPFEMPELLERVRAILRRTESARSRPQPEPARAFEEILAPSGGNQPKPVSVKEGIAALILNPQGYPKRLEPPALAIPYLAALLLLVVGGLALVPGPAPKLALAGLLAFLLWGAAVVVLVVASSLAAMPLGWRQGARLISLAGLPVLFKLCGALVITLWTTLSPFYFTASPALLWASAPVWVGRLDLFELWSAGLLAILLQKGLGQSNRKGWTIAALVWAAVAFLATAIQKVMA